MKNAISWFEIPVTNMARAVKFYEITLGIKLKQEDFGGLPNAIFVTDDREGVGGALVLDPKRSPTNQGTQIYLDVTGKLDDCIKRVTEAGGKVLLPKTHIGDPGFIALILDPEGNQIGLHSPR